MFSQIFDLFIPNFFSKSAIPEITNPSLLAAISSIKSAKTIDQAIETALILMDKKFRAQRFQTYLYFYLWFEKDPNVLWQRQGFMHCTQQNLLFRALMVKSGWLKDEQISFGYSLVWYISPHQFLVLRIKNNQIAIDPWNYEKGVQPGYYAVGFGSKQLTT